MPTVLRPLLEAAPRTLPVGGIPCVCWWINQQRSRTGALQRQRQLSLKYRRWRPWSSLSSRGMALNYEAISLSAPVCFTRAAQRCSTFQAKAVDAIMQQGHGPGWSAFMPQQLLLVVDCVAEALPVDPGGPEWR